MKKRVSLQSGRGFAILTVPCAILVAHKVEHIFTEHCFCRVSKTTPKNNPGMTRSCAKKGSQNGAPWAGLAAKMKLPLGKNSTYLQKPCSRCSPARFLQFVAPIFRKGLQQEPQDASGWTSRGPRVSLSSPWAGLAAKMKVPLGKTAHVYKNHALAAALLVFSIWWRPFSARDSSKALKRPLNGPRDGFTQIGGTGRKAITIYILCVDMFTHVYIQTSNVTLLSYL